LASLPIGKVWISTCIFRVQENQVSLLTVRRCICFKVGQLVMVGEIYSVKWPTAIAGYSEKTKIQMRIIQDSATVAIRITTVLLPIGLGMVPICALKRWISVIHYLNH